jgi:anti-sigma factor RsiW
MPIEPASTQQTRRQLKVAQALPLPHGPTASRLRSDQEQAADREPVKQTDLRVILAWALVVIPIIWGFLQTLRYSLLLFQ